MKKLSNFIFQFAQLNGMFGASQNIRHDNFINSEKNILETFIREFLQNLYDARKSNNKPARAKIRILTDNEFDLKYLESISEELEEPLEIKLSSISNKRILVIEEEGTTGLKGDLEIEAEGSDHIGFWHNVGHSEEGKLSSNRKSGSAGQGNIIYFGISKIFTAFVYTRRENAKSHEEYVMGKCELPSTWSDKNNKKKRYDFQGFWANITKSKEVKPINDAAEIQKFKNSFKLQRNFSETGLSLVIPFIRDEINEEGLLKAAIKEYFYAILLGNIEIDVFGQNLTRDTVMDIADIYAPETKEYRNFLCECITISDDEIVKVKETWIEEQKSENLDDDSFEDLQVLNKAKENFGNGKVIALSFPTKIEEKGKKKIHDANFKLYLTSSCSSEDRNVMRNGIPISKEPKKRSPLGANFRSLLLIETDELGAYCKRAETPNHTEFDPKRKSFTDKYARDTHFPALRRISDLIAKYFIGIEDSLNNDLLKEFMRVKVFDPGNNLNPPKPTPNKPNIPSPQIYIRHEYFNITEGNGWRMEEHNDQLPHYPARLECLFGIAEEGSPHNERPKAYDPSDFNFGIASQNWLINTHGCKVISQDFNKIELEVSAHKFFIEIQNPAFFDRFDLISSITLI